MKQTTNSGNLAMERVLERWSPIPMNCRSIPWLSSFLTNEELMEVLVSGEVRTDPEESRNPESS
jgi:hypothetical protein